MALTKNDRESKAYVSPTNATTTAYATSLVVSSGPAILCGFSGYNSGAAQYLQIHDAAALPANGTVPAVVFDIAATSKFGIDFGANPRKFTTGIVICNSSTVATKTLGAADIWVDAQYKPGAN